MRPADFRTLLLAQTGVVAAVAGRVYRGLIPPEAWSDGTTKPCYVVSTVNISGHATFCGRDALEAEVVQVDCYSRTYDGAVDLSILARQIVDFKGAIGQTQFVAVRLDSETDLEDPEPGLYRRVLTFTVWNRSTAS